jgi:hypothetical protein
MRADRDDAQRLDLRPHDRSAGREVVGGGAGRGRTHHAVAAPPGQRAAVDLHDDLEHPLPGGFLDADLVDRERARHELAVAVDADVEREPVLRGVAPVHDRIDRGLDVVVLGLREEADVTQVDAQHRGESGVGDLRGAEDAAVAADHHGQLALVAGVGLRVGEL